MNIDFSRKEEKTDVLECDNITYCYLLAISGENPGLWSSFCKLIEGIDKKRKKEE